MLFSVMLSVFPRAQWLDPTKNPTPNRPKPSRTTTRLSAACLPAHARGPYVARVARDTRARARSRAPSHARELLSVIGRRGLHACHAPHQALDNSRIRRKEAPLSFLPISEPSKQQQQKTMHSLSARPQKPKSSPKPTQKAWWPHQPHTGGVAPPQRRPKNPQTVPLYPASHPSLPPPSPPYFSPTCWLSSRALFASSFGSATGSMLASFTSFSTLLTKCRSRRSLVEQYLSTSRFFLAASSTKLGSARKWSAANRRASALVLMAWIEPKKCTITEGQSAVSTQIRAPIARELTSSWETH